MPVTLQPAAMKYKKRDGTFHSADCIKGDTGNGIPSGGTHGQYLMRNTGAEAGASWESPVNSATETESGKVLDARMGKTLNDAIANQIQARNKLNNKSLLDTSLAPGLYFITNATDNPSGSSSNGYLDVTTRSDLGTTYRRVEWRPYNSQDVYVNFLANSSTWSGWDKLALASNLEVIQKFIPQTVTANINSVATLNSTLENMSFNTISIEASYRPTLVNAGLIPVNAAGTWTVKKLSSGYMFLEYTTYNGHTYFATINNSVLSGWKELAIKDNVVFNIGDTFKFGGSNVPFRTLIDLSGIYFSYDLPFEVASDVTTATVSITSNSPTWFTEGDLGPIQSGATAGNININSTKRNIVFSLPVPNTIPKEGFGICSLNATITFA